LRSLEERFKNNLIVQLVEEVEPLRLFHPISLFVVHGRTTTPVVDHIMVFM